jgi:hypothetical protein
MADDERDSTEDWLLPAQHRPATMLELEQRVDVALAIAKGAEAAALEIGDAALDAAQQAHRAAELAERAVGAGVGRPGRARNGGSETSVDTGGPPPPDNGAEVPAGDGLGDERLRLFTERADRVVARLRALERSPQQVG